VAGDARIDHDDPLAVSYSRLRRIASRLMQRERAGHTFSPTDLVHEAWAKLLTSESPPTDLPPLEFMKRCWGAMSQVLIDRARAKGTAKRGGKRARINLDDLDDLETAIENSAVDWEALHRALAELAQTNGRHHAIITLRFFGGMEIGAIARQVSLDERTVRRDLSVAKAWLRKRLGASYD
jgi:RNA polymerase sigma factor (TIGR02999 family)